MTHANAILSPRSVRHLRSLGHALSATVQIGKEGITPALVAAAKSAILTHELIKVKVHGEAPIERRAAASELAAHTDALLAQIVGRTFLLYRRHPKKPKIEFPGAQPEASSAKVAKPSKKRRTRQKPEGSAPGASRGRAPRGHDKR